MAYTDIDRLFSWDPVKNDWLKEHRGVSFEAVESHLEGGGLLDIVEHPNQEKYPGQRVFIVQIEDYVYWVPFRETGEITRLITVIPSRKMTRKYLGRKYAEI